MPALGTGWLGAVRYGWHGTGDRLLGTHHAHELSSRATDPLSLLPVEGGSHAEGMMIGQPEALGAPL